MENALSNRKRGYYLGFYFTRASHAAFHTHQKSEAVLMTLLNDQLGIINERYYRDYMSTYAKYKEADGHKTLNSEILQTI